MKKTNSWVFILLILVGLSGLGALFWWVYQQLKPTPISTSVTAQSDEVKKVADENILTVLESKVNNLFNQTVSNSTNYFEAIAGEALTANSVVVIIDNKAYLFDSTNDEHFNLQCGFVLSAVDINDAATVYISGTITLSSNVLDANTKYFSGNNGNLIDAIPDNYGIQSVGYALSTNQIILDFSERYSL